MIHTLLVFLLTLGIEVLEQEQFEPLRGKRVALCTNPTGVDHQLRSTVDILYNGQEQGGYRLVALYGPEHGVRGNAHAGDAVSNATDELTGIPMYSLYGKTRKPSAEMLRDVDCIVYDIQDIGCRSFTYISTMGMLMQACEEQDKELIVLDRPNPLGGEKIEGNLVEDGYVSFVSQFKIPYVYGQTCGELALYLNAQSEAPCRLKVIPMQGWRRDMTWEQTGLEWVVASPHIPQAKTACFYPATGIFGELGYVSIGVGYTLPFELIGAPWIDANKLALALNSRQVPGVEFRPIYFKPYYGNFSGEQSQGVQIHIMDYAQVHLSDLQFIVVEALMELYPDRDVFKLCNQKRLNMFDKVCGSPFIRQEFSKRYKWADIRDYWYKDAEAYRKASEPYYLYP
ncbi:MAG: DUF1343 domain-containing protein [Paludibacteraceae bacterium]|nr:DUF1343 domain-containing protein [Paludibacteraceae bacterium]